MTRIAGIAAPCPTHALIEALRARHGDLVVLHKDESGHPVDPSRTPGLVMVACDYEHLSRSLVITVHARGAR